MFYVLQYARYLDREDQLCDISKINTCLIILYWLPMKLTTAGGV